MLFAAQGEPAFLAPGQAWEHSRSASQRKLQGQWPTPWWVVQRSLDGVLHGLPERPVILDPACGDGRWLAAVGLRIPGARLIGWDLDAQAIQAAQSVLDGAGLKAELLCRDALDGQAEPVADLVLGNPPYIRPQNLPRDKRQAYWAKFEVLTDKCDLYAAFVDRMIQLSRGPVAVVLGDTWLSMASYQALRDRVWSQPVAGVWSLPQGTFGARIGTVLLHIAAPGIRQRGHLDRQGFHPTGTLKMCDGVLPLVDAPELAGQGTLGERLRLRMGVVCGAYKDFVHRGSRGLLDEPTCRGKQVQRWAIHDDGEWLRYDPRAMLDARPYVAPKTRALFDVPEKVVLAGASGTELRAAVDTQRRFPLDSCYVSQGAEDVWALCGLLNSAPANAWYGARFPKARVKAVELHQMPWPAGDLQQVAEAARAGDQAGVDAAAAKAWGL